MFRLARRSCHPRTQQEAMIGLPVTVLPIRRMYVPALGLAASVMPPD